MSFDERSVCRPSIRKNSLMLLVGRSSVMLRFRGLPQLLGYRYSVYLIQIYLTMFVVPCHIKFPGTRVWSFHVVYDNSENLAGFFRVSEVL